jgi:hypothetical protein
MKSVSVIFGFGRNSMRTMGAATYSVIKASINVRKATVEKLKAFVKRSISKKEDA